MQEREREDEFVVPSVWPPAPPVEPVRAAWWRTPVPLAGVAVAVVAVGVGAYFAGHATAPSTATDTAGAAVPAGGGSSIHVRGTLSLPLLGFIDTSVAGQNSDGDTCQATSGYDDITGGAAVTVGGATGQTLGIGALSSGGISNSACVFSFDVPVPSGQSVYTVTISHRGTQTFTADQVKQPIALSLGN